MSWSSDIAVMMEDEQLTKVRNRRTHMANERTFLAWIRTSIAIMAFGFVVERFALFLRQLAFLLGKETVMPSRGYSSVFAIVLVGLGALMGMLSFVRYKKVKRQIDEDTYQPGFILDILLTISVLVVGLFLVVYLFRNI
jgi:putative membrane protein